MAYEIVWTTAAQEDYRQIVDYLFDTWSYKVAARFTDRLFNDLTILESMPYVGKSHSQMSAVRELVIDSHYVLFYAVVRNEVILLNLVSTKRKI